MRSIRTPNRLPQTGSIRPSQTPTVSITTLPGGMKIMFVSPAPVVGGHGNTIITRSVSLWKYQVRVP